jgi:hypothetical protein
MNLNEQFEKETGLQSEMQDLKFGTWGYSQEYVEWLEAKINYTQCCEELFCEDEDLGYQTEKCKKQCEGCSFIEKRIAK